MQNPHLVFYDFTLQPNHRGEITNAHL